MTIVLALVAAFGVGSVAGIVAERFWISSWRTLPTTKEADERLDRIRNHIEYRVAIHEAGHTITGWYHPYVAEFPRITIDDGRIGEGFVMFARGGGERPDALWCDIAVHLGGIAAEVLEFKKFRSGHAESDLVKAKANALKLVERGELTPPWSEPTEPDDFNLAKVFGEIDEKTARVLDLAYARAKYLVSRDERRLDIVAAALMEKGVLTNADLRKLLGWRRPTFFR
jgi:ATP-dependent Zn protease